MDPRAGTLVRGAEKRSSGFQWCMRRAEQCSGAIGVTQYGASSIARMGQTPIVVAVYTTLALTLWRAMDRGEARRDRGPGARALHDALRDRGCGAARGVCDHPHADPVPTLATDRRRCGLRRPRLQYPRLRWPEPHARFGQRVDHPDDDPDGNRPVRDADPRATDATQVVRVRDRERGRRSGHRRWPARRERVVGAAPARRPLGAWRGRGVGREPDHRSGRLAEGGRPRVRHADGPHRDRAALAPRALGAGVPRRAGVAGRDLGRRRLSRCVLDRRRLRPVLLGGPPLRCEPCGDGELPHAGRHARARVRDPRGTAAAAPAGRRRRDRDRRAPRGASVTPGGSRRPSP